VANASSSATGGGAGTDLSQANATGGAGGAGGLATATATGQSTGSGAVDVTASATGGSGATGGGANAYATGLAITGNVQAKASANGGTSGNTPGNAFARSDAKNSHGEAVTTATAPRGGAGTSPSASTEAAILTPTGNVSASIAAGQVVSDAILTPAGGLDFGIGAVTAAYGGPEGTTTLDYAATTLFDFTPSTTGVLDLRVLSDPHVRSGFDRLNLQVVFDGKSLSTDNLTSLTSAETFFTNLTTHPLLLGSITKGIPQSVSITYDLIYNVGTQAAVGDGFGFTYALQDPPLTAPEPSTWTMMLLGFGGLGYAGMRRSSAPRLA
jgi:hypothetical protein